MNYMSQDYNTCQSVHHSLDDLQGARMSGQDAGDGMDTDHITATYIWATAKMHKVMEHQFFKQPAIAVVLAHHLAATAVLPNEQLPNKVQALEQKLAKLSSKIHGLESKQYNKLTKFSDTTPPSPTGSILQSAKNGPGGVPTSNPPLNLHSAKHIIPNSHLAFPPFLSMCVGMQWLAVMAACPEISLPLLLGTLLRFCSQACTLLSSELHVLQVGLPLGVSLPEG